MTEEDRDRILQMVAYIKQMNYQSQQAMMDSSNWRKLLDILDKANKLCIGVVASMNSEDKTNATPSTITITWSSDDNCYIARHNEHRYLSGHGDTPEHAIAELKIAIEGATMSNVRHTVVCLHLNSDTYIVGYLISSDSEKIIIAGAINETEGSYAIIVPLANIKQRYDIPVTWW